MIGKLLGHPRLVVALVLALTVPLGVCASRLETDNTLPAWLPPDDPQLQAYQRFRAVFGEDQFVLVALDEVNTADEGLRRAVGAFAASLRARPDVATVVAPWDEAGAPGQGLGGGHLVSADGRMAAAKRGPAPLAPVSSAVALPSALPSQTATVRSRV